MHNHYHIKITEQLSVFYFCSGKTANWTHSMLYSKSMSIYHMGKVITRENGIKTDPPLAFKYRKWYCINR